MSLHDYWDKRKFEETPEPRGKSNIDNKKDLKFVIQKHHASHLHYDFRLEMEGVLKSWAVPKGPSMNPDDRRLAMMVEDHPYDYRNFEGIIPEGNYGAGKVIVWDEGTYEPKESDNNDPEKTLLNQLENGDLKFILHGKKLKGEFTLVKLKKEDKSWLLIKKKDEYASQNDITQENKSVKSDKDVEELGNTKTEIPKEIKPMLASLIDKPFDNKDWVFEIKWDGYRAISQIQKNKVRLYSRNNNDFNEDYPNIITSLEKIDHDAILDGEIVVVDKDGRSEFQSLQNYKKNNKENLKYYVFDLLYLDGYDIRNQSLIDRKSLLKSLLPKLDNIEYSEHVEEKGIDLFKLAEEKKLEGIIAKKKDSEYVSKRTSDWLKIKNIKEQEAIICGFTEPQGSRKKFGALLLGEYQNGILTYVGHTGSGFDDEKLTTLYDLLNELKISESPFDNPPKPNAPVTWVKPQLVCQIKFSEITDDGIMRQAIFLGLRNDKSPKEVEPERTVTISQVSTTHEDKIYWPDDGFTKKDMLNYYEHASKFILPYLTNRLQSLHRFPNGINGQSFFQKDIIDHPDWVKTVPIKRDDEKVIHYLLCENKETLLYIANLGCIEMNPWNSQATTLGLPDYLIIDLDPNDISFEETISIALGVKKILDKAQIDSFIKTSGKRGLHIMIPLGAKYNFDQTRQFAEIIANNVHTALPEVTSIVRDPKKRQKKVYIDFLQNRIGQTIAAPYSLRPVKGAQVSTPLHWSEITKKLSPDMFTIKTIFKRLDKQGDIWSEFRNHSGIDMLKSLDLLANN